MAAVDRVDDFAAFGWETFFFNEIEVNDKNVLDVLGGGQDCCF